MIRTFNSKPIPTKSSQQQPNLTNFFSKKPEEKEKILKMANWETLITLNNQDTNQLHALLINHPKIFTNPNTLGAIPKNLATATVDLLMSLCQDRTITKALGENETLLKNIEALYQNDKSILLKLINNETFFTNFFIEQENWIKPSKKYKLTMEDFKSCPWAITRISDIDLLNSLLDDKQVFEAALKYYKLTSDKDALHVQFSILSEASKTHQATTFLSIINIASIDYLSSFLTKNYLEENYYTKEELDNPPFSDLNKKRAIIECLKKNDFQRQYILIKLLSALIEPALIEDIKGLLKFDFHEIRPPKDCIDCSINLKVSYINSLQSASIEQWSQIELYDFNSLFTENELTFAEAQKGLLALKTLYLDQLIKIEEYDGAINFIIKENESSPIYDSLSNICKEHINYLIKIKAYDKIIDFAKKEVDPRSILAQEALSLYLKNLRVKNSFTKLLNLYKKLPVNLQPTSQEALYQDYIKYLFSINDYKKAIEITQKLATTTEKPYELKYLYSLMILDYLNQGDVENAIAKNDALTNTPDQPFTLEEIYEQHISNLENSHKYQDAINFIYNNMSHSEEVHFRLFDMYEKYIGYLIQKTQTKKDLLAIASQAVNHIGRDAAYFLQAEVYIRHFQNYQQAFSNYKSAIEDTTNPDDPLTTIIQRKSKQAIAEMFITGKIKYNLQNNSKELVIEDNTYNEHPNKASPEYHEEILNRYIPAYEYVRTSDDDFGKRLKMDIMCKLTGKGSLTDQITEKDFILQMPEETALKFMKYYQITDSAIAEELKNHFIISVHKRLTDLGKANEKLDLMHQQLGTFQQTIAVQGETIKKLEQTITFQGETIVHLMQKNDELSKQNQQIIQLLSALTNQATPKPSDTTGGMAPRTGNFFRMP